MEIDIRLMEGFTYSVSAGSFPASVVVNSQIPVTIDQNVNLNRLEFCSQDIEYYSFGINRTILSKSTNTIELSSNNPIVLSVDLFEKGTMDEEEEVLPGRYKIEAEVTVYVHSDDGRIEAKVIELDRELYVDVVE